MTIAVKPIYGNGWTDGRTDIPEPPPFQIEGCNAIDGMISGKIVACRELIYVGAMFEANQRYECDSSIYNCRIEMKNGLFLFGYCSLDI